MKTRAEKVMGILSALAIALAVAFTLCSCSGVYWHETKTDALGQKLGYKRMGWPADQSCKAYPTTPVQRSTWAKQHFWRITKAN